MSHLARTHIIDTKTAITLPNCIILMSTEKSPTHSGGCQYPRSERNASITARAPCKRQKSYTPRTADWPSFIAKRHASEFAGCMKRPLDIAKSILCCGSVTDRLSAPVVGLVKILVPSGSTVSCMAANGVSMQTKRRPLSEKQRVIKSACKIGTSAPPSAAARTEI